MDIRLELLSNEIAELVRRNLDTVSIDADSIVNTAAVDNAVRNSENHKK